MAEDSKRQGNGLVVAVDFSRDMAENLLLAFSGTEQDDVRQVEIREFGVWVVEPVSGMRQFVGSMTIDPRVTKKGVC